MAFTICDRHGGGVSAVVCAHIADAILGRATDSVVKNVVAFEVYDQGELSWGYDICPTCATVHGLGSGPIHLQDDGSKGGLLDDLYASQCPTCAKCYLEWL